MKIAILGDIHGRPTWKWILNHINEYDKIVFMGDYCDSYDIHWSHWVTNLIEIIQFKIMYSKKVTLLIGNHDLSYYFSNEQFPCSGFQTAAYYKLHHLFNEYKHLFQMAVEFDDYLFTHAGVSAHWLGKNNEYIDKLPVVDQVNALFLNKPQLFAFTSGRKFDGTGNEVTQPPVWIRPEALSKSMAYPRQVVGHTQSKYPELITNGIQSVIYVDSPDYLTQLIDGEFSFIQIN